MNPVDPRDPARNLLFGLLAFQNNFIDRRALLAAFDAWTADKSRPLGRVLAEQGAISEDLLTLIDGIVAAHLARHDNEPVKSLAALTQVGSMRLDLEALADPEARASLSHLSVTLSNYDSFTTNINADATSTSVGVQTSAGVRFHVLRPLNRGGMGIVSVALDTELPRPFDRLEGDPRYGGVHDAGYRARFLAEAEITGKLEHPGIIPIYGLGTYPDGRPFYAMRLIRGDKTGSLMDVPSNASTRSLVRRPAWSSFAACWVGSSIVCNALRPTPTAGACWHRDLEARTTLPARPLRRNPRRRLGPRQSRRPCRSAGVRRWRLRPAQSLRKRISSNAGWWRDGHARVRPSRADDLRPCQHRPSQRRLRPGCGPLLPHHGPGTAFSRKGTDLGKLIPKIEAGHFPPPRQVRAEIDKPLEAICLKAMA